MTQTSPPAAHSVAPTPRFFALIPCAGVGSRAGTAQPKQYHMLAGRPLVAHTLQAFAQVPRIARSLLVLAPGDTFAELPNASFLIAACGGSTRSASVLNGLHALQAQGAQAHDWVLVHDAARCLITPAQINALIDACQHDAVGGLLAQPLADTLKSAADGRVAGTIARSDKWLAQTPQMFRLGTLSKALGAALEASETFGASDASAQAITDEASAMEAQGLRPLLVPGSAQNFKVTYPEDFALAEALLHSRAAP